jgi:hypothetical protein
MGGANGRAPDDSRSTSRVISAVVALPCSIPGDQGPPACSLAPSGLKMAVIARDSAVAIGAEILKAARPAATITAEVM